jgi:hypothetical protein
MTMNNYKFEHKGKTIPISARNRRTADRRFRGWLRNELDIQGKTILAKARTPRGRSMNPDRTAMGLRKKNKED